MPLIPKGRLAETPLPEILVRVARSGASGILTVRSGGARRRLLFRDGRLAAVDNPPQGVLDRTEAMKAVQQVAQSLDGGFDWTDGLDPAPASALEVELPPLAVRSLLKDTPMEHVGKIIYAMSGSYRCEPADLGPLRQEATEQELEPIARLAGRATSDDLLAKLGGNERARRLLVAAVTSGALTTAPPRQAPPPRVEPLPSKPPQARVEPLPSKPPRVEPLPSKPPAANAPAPAAGHGAIDGVSDELSATAAKLGADEVQPYVLAKRRTLAQSNHYQVLELPRDAPRRVIEEHYLRALKRYHPDSYFGDMDDETKEAIEEIFARVNESYEVLVHPDKRAEYDKLLASGLVSRSQLTEEDYMLAKSQLETGKKLLSEGDWLKARPALEAALRLNPDSAETLAYLGKSYLEGGTANRMPDRAFELLTQAIEREPDRGEYHAMLGEYHRIRKDPSAAARCFQAAVSLDKDLAWAQRALKELKAGGDDGGGGGGGLLGGLFKGKKKD